MSLSNIQSIFSSPDPDIAYFRKGGNGDGTQNNPYGPFQGQAAYDRGFKYFDIGANVDIGSIGTSIENEELFFRGAGKESKVYVFSNGKNLTVWDICGISCYLSLATNSNTGDSGDLVVHYGYVYAAETGGILTSGIARNGGNITLFGPMAVALYVSANGGNNDGIGDDGGNAGTISIGYGVKFLPSAIGITATGGIANGGGANGADGSITLRGCDTGTVVADAGVGGTITRIGAIENGVFYAS